ncbi:MAG: hypothetical protein Q8R98_15535, partial [Rubrivivax sp.]|nr:hypothetical protein [Rubrivivax sp.]
KGPAFSAKSPVPAYFSPERNLGRHYLYADGGFHADWYVGYNNCWIIKLPPVPTGGFAKGPFTGLTPFPERDDPQLGGSSQGIFMLLGKYQIGTAYELSGGLRVNRWSGAYAVQTTSGPLAQWNEPFNVNWGGIDANGVPNPGYSARSTDFMLGVRKYVNPKLVGYVGLTYLGKASTDNPSERGQSNSALFASIGARYVVDGGLSVSGSLNAVSYARKGLAPLSMGSHDAFSNVDSRVANRVNWVSVEVNYQF